MIIAYICSKSPNDQYRVQIRCQNIAEAIQRTGFHSAYLVDIETFIQNTPEAQEICQKADLLVVHRHLYGAVIKTILLWKARGKKVIADFDEAVNLITPEMPSYSFWKKGVSASDRFTNIVFGENPIDPAPLDQFCWGLKAVDAATVPSIRLADDWSTAVRTFFLPDYLNTDQYMVQRPGNNGYIHIGVSGNAVNFSNLQRSGLAAALESVSQQRENIVIHFFELEESRIENTRIPAKQRRIHNNIQAYRWPMFLSNLDIGIAYAEGKFSMRTSKLRVIEYSVLKIPWLASNLLPFREMDRYGRLVPNTEEQWTRAILEVIDHLQAYQAEANGEPFLYGISQDVFENVDKIVAIYDTVLNSR
ncbi:MAG: hypothetical protein IH586_06095 [Anaerolineaceae bacterium]|nr:hypothetical protein [Anaerolineaceae bacterium]